MKPQGPDSEERLARYRKYSAAPSMRDEFPEIEELAIDLRFADPDGQPMNSLQRRIFLPPMQAFFELQCPARGCSNGGFNLARVVPSVLQRSAGPVSGRLLCHGHRRRNGADGDCGVELQYEIHARRRGQRAE